MVHNILLFFVIHKIPMKFSRYEAYLKHFSSVIILIELIDLMDI